jgi:hypothetical protein
VTTLLLWITSCCPLVAPRAAALRDERPSGDLVGAGGPGPGGARSPSTQSSSFVVGDLAGLANRWSLTGGTMPDGSPVELGAATAEVARLQPDGTWLYVIDNAWGDQAAP